MVAPRVLTVAVAAVLLVATARGQSDWVAPDGYDHLIPRLAGTTPRVFSNLRYEGNNRSLRGPFDPAPGHGCATAERYRAFARRTRGLFVLRDALFSQQDHPIEHRACAIMMPANWVTAVVDDVRSERALRPMQAPGQDDAAWAALATPAAMFGSFPPSQRLFETARRPYRTTPTAEGRAEIRNARFNVRALAVHARHLLRAAPDGPARVAAVGAERIAGSDRQYFTASLRRERVIVLAVEHPNEHELRDEGKGIAIWGRDVPADTLRMVRNAILQRRLQDGPLAIERYDLTVLADRRRAIEVLETLIPEGSTGHDVWLWVGGGLIEGTEQVRDAGDQLPSFRAELAAADLAEDRLHLFVRPSFRLVRHSEAELHAAVARSRRMGLPLSILGSSAALRRRLPTPPGAGGSR